MRLFDFGVELAETRVVAARDSRRTAQLIRDLIAESPAPDRMSAAECAARLRDDHRHRGRAVDAALRLLAATGEMRRAHRVMLEEPC